MGKLPAALRCIHAATMLAICCLLGGSQVVGAGEPGEPISALQQYDFSAELALCPLRERFSDAEVTRAVGIKARAAQAHAAADELLLGVRVLPNGSWWTCNDTVALIACSAQRTGLPPRSGCELFPELLTPAGYRAFLAMSAEERVARYIGGINPVTRRFYASFDSGSSERGGIVLQPLPCNAAENRSASVHGNYGAYSVTLLSSIPGEVLSIDSLTVCE